MIPVRLSLQNFMCYRTTDPPLDFNGIHLACLSGDNGNGKSALIDAMTWALWGKTRAGSDDDLIHGAEAEMSVEFDFKVGQQLYRIIRRRARPKRRGGAGQSALELQIDTGGSFRPVTGDTIAQTQQKIIDTLHMDYDTFINSAYLRQGHADEFTRQAPARRKEVLGNILGLAVYDELEERAKEMAKRQETETAQLESTIADIAAELTRKPDYEVELEQARERLAGIEASARDKEAAFNELRQKKEAMDSRKAQLDEITARLEGGTRNLESWEDQARQHRARIEEYEEIIGRRAAIEEGYEKYSRARKTNDELEQKFRQSVNLERQRAQLEDRVKEAGHNLNTEHAVIQGEISNIEVRVQKLPGLKNQLSQAQAKMRQLAGSETALKDKEQACQELQLEVSRMESDNVRLEREIAELAEKLDLLSTHLAGDTGGTCPLCETELTREGLQLIETKYNREKQEKEGLLKAGRDSMARKRAEMEALRKERAQQESELSREKTEVQSRVSVITSEITEAEEAEMQLAELVKKRESVELRLVQRDFAASEQAALAEVESELGQLGYDAGKHEETRRQLGQLEPYERDKRKLEDAERLLDQEKTGVARADEAARELRESLGKDNEKKEALAVELTQLPQVLAELEQAEAEHREMTVKRNQAQEAVGSIKARLEHLTELEARKKEKEGQLAGAAREGTIFKELARAFGKTGVQALLIEMALPEIVNEANRLLGRMTDNRMHIEFETQQETKSGTVRETLAINIADELGTRNYEMFSGGEAFRINFAIRIALSRLLAKRAGAPLPTLIIDEGFGTQDSTGMEKLKEAINSIQGDFEKVLVITHMDELKDAFPVRIDVVKTGGSSRITVS